MPDTSVGPLERGLAVLRALAAPEAPDRVRHGDLVRVTGLARSTVDRVISTLGLLGLVRSDGREAAVAPPLLRLAGAYLSACGIPAALGPAAERLADELDESVSVAVPDGDGVRFVRQSARRRAVSPAFRLGELVPGERCAPGALFAGLPDGAGTTVREGGFRERVAAAARDGWAVDDQLLEPGLVALAVPVRDGAGRTVCAVSVASHTSRHSPASLREAALPRLNAVRDELEASLAARRTAAGPADVREGRPGGPGNGPAQERDASADLRDGVTEEREARPGGAHDGSLAVRDTSLDGKRELGAGFLQSLARGLAVMEALGADRGEGMTLAAVARATGLARATARRSLLTLAGEGYATCEGGRFRLLPRVLELGCARLSGLGTAELAQPHLVRLVERVGESASLAVLDGTDIRYVARVPTVRIMSVDITVGTRFPAYATSMGRVLLAGLSPAERPPLPARSPALTRHTVTSGAALERIVARAAADGHAVVDEELEDGLRSLAVPVRDAHGRVVAALNVARHAGVGTADSMRDELLPALRETAREIETDLRALGALGWTTPGQYRSETRADRP
ncbi:IclR family transcriptional regulator domain-containing protein [Streptomyces sp. SP18CS02]|uniref:IclR family transcriptional regulator domain-containing protein n=1 Tax=Streptomyces sp. SP18CS02 TaxID=3002531 RepID=UPI002E77DA7E|nr:IclR family transcriptional regulator C-terminal domain-containing protein [Streptomyces sp. SP18CS02]MEE1754556.1 IclR family transcriptional regulator C-terminal domain-containing protein [Streptomyces sp. SP18CS02]